MGPEHVPLSCLLSYGPRSRPAILSREGCSCKRQVLCLFEMGPEHVPLSCLGEVLLANVLFRLELQPACLVAVVVVLVRMVVLALTLVMVRPEMVVIEEEVMVAISMLIVVLSVTMALVRSSGVAVAGMSGNGDDIPG